jgi:hypothetical protein
MPGTVISFDAAKQTVVVQPAIKERVILDGKITWQSLPPLPDVPIVVPRAGGYVLSLPIAAGDECLIVFGDQCIDGWWQSSGVQMQIDKRRHDLSDGFAVMGAWSQPRVLSGYSTDSVQLRNDVGDTYLEVKGQVINIIAPDNVNIQSAKSIVATATENITATATQQATLNGVAKAVIESDTEVDVTAPTVKVNASTACAIICPQIGLSGAWSGLQSFVMAVFKTLYNFHTHNYTDNPSGDTRATGIPNTPMDDTYLTAKVKGL